jgi:geranylgeranyl diphosphate synthase type I
VSRTLVDAVSDALRRFLDEQARRLADMDVGLVTLTDRLADYTAGGKRLRPAFCFHGWLGAGGGEDLGSDAAPAPPVVAAAALELLQASAIIHDDLMDDSDIRRGHSSMHVTFRRVHADASRLGDARRFGAAAAILLGDLAQAWADEMLRTCGLPQERVLAGLRCFDVMRTEVITGQYLDLLAQTDRAASLEQAVRVLRYKSARYTVTRPLELGGVLAGAGPELLAAYRAIGDPVGEAFQLRDDLLGVFGDPALTGKPTGDDLREGKRTVLVALAYQGADARGRQVLDRWLGDADLTVAGTDQVRTVLEDSGAVKGVERLIGDRIDEALAALLAAPLVRAAERARLADLAIAAVERNR